MILIEIRDCLTGNAGDSQTQHMLDPLIKIFKQYLTGNYEEDLEVILLNRGTAHNSEMQQCPCHADFF